MLTSTRVVIGAETTTAKAGVLLLLLLVVGAEAAPETAESRHGEGMSMAKIAGVARSCVDATRVM